MGNNWRLLGLYYERYTPFIETYGVKLIEGYYNCKTGKHKMYVRQKIKTSYSIDMDKRIRELKRLGYEQSENFLVDVAKTNIEIFKLNRGK